MKHKESLWSILYLGNEIELFNHYCLPKPVGICCMKFWCFFKYKKLFNYNVLNETHVKVKTSRTLNVP